jgi:16S rRNA (guanine966-N2)-methyltransferase
MRIISGLLKGKSINFLKNSITRPLKDIVKENIFNILSHSNLVKINFTNSKVLDAYSGVGSFGIECLSRGAKKATFIESNKYASKILEENLKYLSINSKASVFNNKVEKFLEINKQEKYNILFLDPPFSDNTFIQNLRFIKENRMYDAKHVVILHRERKSYDNFENIFNIIITRQYGRSNIFFGLFN